MSRAVFWRTSSKTEDSTYHAVGVANSYMIALDEVRDHTQDVERRMGCPPPSDLLIEIGVSLEPGEFYR